MSGTTYDWATISVLWARDLKRFFRQPSRIAGALGQPIIFWAVIGSGMATTFKIPNLEMNYLEFFFPGVVLMVLVFASIFASISIIDDRSGGFLQAVLAGPGSRGSMVVGKCLGATTVAFVQAGLFLFFAPLAGFELGAIHWPLLISAMFLASFGLTALGFVVAWILDNVQAYHAIQMTILVPLWVVSGAMFPADPDSKVFTLMMSLNPVAYGVTAVRHALYGGSAPLETVSSTSPLMAMMVLLFFCVVSLGLAVGVCERRR
ncbi:MAG: ABC transporter permease [Myxococcota bacterium]|nr:ABC transporter permease [Myxococcota bacterium]